MTRSGAGFVAVDVGNSRLKFARFAGDAESQRPLPRPVAEFTLVKNGDFAPLSDWFDAHSPASPGPDAAGGLIWYLSSVQRAAAQRLCDWVERDPRRGRVRFLSQSDVPLPNALAAPEKTGMDRLCAAVAAARMRAENQPAVAVDVGTAITVDYVSRDGVYLGGTILPGLQTSAHALHSLTDLLPLIDAATLDAPPPLPGRDTLSAMRAGLFWGAVGSIREIARQYAQQDAIAPRLLLTGGGAVHLASVLPEFEFTPHLTLAGVALTAFAAARVAS